MDAVEFLKTKKRMCENFIGTCVGCPIRDEKHRERISCDKYMRDYPVEAIAIIEKWLAEHPIKTRQSEFLKYYPNTRLDNTGYIVISPCHIDASYEPEICNPMTFCKKCREKYWSEEVE